MLSGRRKSFRGSFGGAAMIKHIRLLLAPALLIAAMGGAYLGWQTWQTKRTLNALAEVTRSMDMEAILRGKVSSLPGETPEGTATSVDLAIRGITLNEGENGFELWRLRADWATLREEIDKVDLSSPHVRYHMGERTNNTEAPSDYLDVTALSGLIEEDNSRITLRGDVRAEHDANILTGPEAVFLNNTRILTFPEGADLNGPTLSGTAKLLRWNVSTNILEGEGGVSMTWTPRDDAAPSGPSAPEQDLSSQEAAADTPAQAKDQIQ